MEDIKRFLKQVGITVAALLIIWYIGDYLSLKIRRAPLSTIQISKLYAVPQKDGKTSFEPGELENETCVNSMFPHLGYSPCWYLKRHRTQQVNL